jgi:NAD(P)-dependent dehydrogenase (short-subunit alcohol dehydrogenase family)
MQAVGLVAEHVVTIRGLFQGQLVGGEAGNAERVAAVGFSEGLRAELCCGPVTVSTVIPGLMRTGSHLQARFTGQAGKEFT